MVSAGRGSCALVESEGALVGLFAERDYIMALNNGEDEEEASEEEAVKLLSSSVKAFATPTADLCLVEPSCSIMHALRLMDSRNIRHLPVVDMADGEGTTVQITSVSGVLTISSLAQWMQRDSEALQSKHLDRLHPRWRAACELEDITARKAQQQASSRLRFPLMLTSFGSVNTSQVLTALASDVLIILAYRAIWILGDHGLGEGWQVNLGMLVAAIPAIYWLRTLDDDDSDDDSEPSAAPQEAASSSQDVGVVDSGGPRKRPLRKLVRLRRLIN